ncbi:hypothetical protein LCGC14_0362670 [marine sediment metagenome]|uniref:Uncharacterized protein n=1 Tax=marine sediment metagenome TaxID=412755 RepID=A0A0F9T7I7_9ZZZZ
MTASFIGAACVNRDPDASSQSSTPALTSFAAC